MGMHEGKALGVAGAVLTVVVAVAAWLAARERPGDSTGTGAWVSQSVRARRDAYTAGRDLKINARSRPGE